MSTKISTLLKMLACSCLVFLAADLQAQLLYKTKFSAVEGYTNGWMIGQPPIGNKWLNANADWSYDTSEAYTSLNNGRSWWPEGAAGPWLIVTATNCTAPEGGAMKVASDNNNGTNKTTYFWKMDFPTTVQGPVTVTWDWQFVCTNEIPNSPLPYGPTNSLTTSNYNGQLPGYDHGFTLSDWANRTADTGDVGDTVPNPNWKYSELSTPLRMSSYLDARRNGQGACGGTGGWNDYGPVFKDGKVIHMKLVGYVTTNTPDEYTGTYEVWAQRDGEDVWQIAFHQDTTVQWAKNGEDPPSEFYISASGFRRCPGETDPNSGINCLMLWMNGTQGTNNYALISNIRVVGPDPVPPPKLSIQKVGADVKVTFDGWLEAADKLEGPYTTIAVQSPYEIPASAAKTFYRANN